MRQRITYIQSSASPKPEVGAPCNGCGLCCLLEPCPLGVVLSGRRQGACVAVVWDHALKQYRCSAVADPAGLLQKRLPAGVQPLVLWTAPLLGRLAKRWIASAQGCDSDLTWSYPASTQIEQASSLTIDQAN